MRRGTVAYEFDPSHVRVVADLLERIEGSGCDLMKVWERLAGDENYKHLSETLRAEIDFIFVYELQENFDSAGEVNLVESGLSLTATRRMSETPAGAWTLWSQVIERLQAPVCNAHISDILLTAKVLTKPDHAASIIAWYLTVAENAEISTQEIALSLARANTIARARGMGEEQRVRAAMHLRSEFFGNNPGNSGPAMTLLAALSVPRRGGEFGPDERESIHSRLVAIGELSTNFVDEVSKTLLRLAEGATELESARRWHVQQYLSFATSTDLGMQKMHHAQTAADLASSYGLSDLRDDAVLIMQSVDQESMGWETVATETIISKNAFRAHLRKFRRSRNWEHALTVFLGGPSPSGDHEENVRNAERTAVGSVRAFVTRTDFGAHGLPERTNGDFLAEEIARAETMMLTITSTLLALELENVRDHFAPPGADRIAEWMVNAFSVDALLVSQFSKSLSLHWTGEFSDSARLSIPLIENAARSLLLALDEPLYRTERGKSPGRFPSMDFYVDALEKRNFDPDWIWALRTTLLSHGMNLRNLAAHGFTMDFTANQSALLLRLAGLFCAMPVVMDQSELASPTNVTRRRLRRRIGWVWS